jgi:glycyl-tRNA synthetase
MDLIYNLNGLVHWDERDIRLRNQFASHFAFELSAALRGMNQQWTILQTEAPILTPVELINPNYTEGDVWFQTGEAKLVMRPETTPGSYAYARHLFDGQLVRPPLCIWQMGKSFRREQDQPTKHMRLKEFYQQEFQCVYTDDTANDYHAGVLDPVRRMISEMVGLPTRIVDSDRLPSYARVTKDIEVDNGDKWMEVASISLRTDFPGTVKFSTKKGMVEKGLLVVEVAIGLDRCVYCFNRRPIL